MPKLLVQKNVRNATIIEGTEWLNIPLQRKCRSPVYFVLRQQEQQHEHMYRSHMTGKLIGKSAAWSVTRGNGLEEGEVVMSRCDWVSCPPFRHSRSHRQSGIKEDGEKMMAWNVNAEGRGTEWISQISRAVFTHSQTLVSPSSNYFNIILCGSWKGRRRFLLRCPMMSFTPLQGTKKPLRPKPQPPTPAPPFRTPPHAFLKSGTFSDLSKKCGASTSKPGSKLSY